MDSLDQTAENMRLILARQGVSSEDRRQYRNGWRASARYADGALERADMRGVPVAWYQGYEDYAAGREYGHQLLCSDHPYCEVPRQ